MRDRTGPRNEPAALDILRNLPPSHRVEVLNVDIGPGHRLFLAQPHRPAPASGFPTLYMLDGNAAFDTLTPALLETVPDLAVIGIGYQTDLRFDFDQRSQDLTPAPNDQISPDPRRPERNIGGAAIFLERLLGPLRDAAEARVPVDPKRRVLWGHSYGGLFTLFALLRRPDAFAGFSAISPSIWVNPSLMQNLAQQAGRLQSAPALMVALGDSEARAPDGSAAATGPSQAVLTYAEELRQTTGINLHVHVLKGANHPQTIAASLPLFLSFAARITPPR